MYEKDMFKDKQQGPYKNKYKHQKIIAVPSRMSEICLFGILFQTIAKAYIKN